MAGGGNIKVVVRVRPFNARVDAEDAEKERNAVRIVEMKDNQTILLPPPNTEHAGTPKKGAKGREQHGADGPKAFAFDRSYWSFDKSDAHYAGQAALFQDLGLPLLDNAFQGYNNCIFAYGQTGSGKSYSMMGYGEEVGIIPLICRDMFRRIDELQRSDPHLTCTVEVSYLEIYNEKVRDLLNPATKGNLKVREHPSTGPYVEDLAKLAVRSFQEIDNLMDEGNKARTVAATNMNQTSSRSHAVFTLTVSQKRHDAETTMDTEKVSRISLVDLAGSERATSTGATGARLKEGAEINRSLSTLGRVIAALADLSSGKVHKKKAASMVPYRDSVLTWLLKDSLGGNSMTAMIAAISPADINYDETLSTLRYADSAKRIQNHAVVNEDPNARMIRELKEELAQLRSKLGGAAAGPAAPAGAGAIPSSAAAAAAGGVPPDEYYPPDTPMEKQMVSITAADGTIKKVSKAEIVEQLNQSEKLYSDLNQTWEEKLQKTEKIHKEREQALEELGISIEKGFVGLSTPKKSPHLVNLSDDPLLTECLVYNLKPGLTVVGHVDAPTPLTSSPHGERTSKGSGDGGEDADTPADKATAAAAPPSEIRLDGSRILPHHCTFEHVDNVVTIVPSPGAAVMVNGLRIDEPKRLRSGFRIILGDFHIFRFNHPMEARAERVEQRLVRQNVGNKELSTGIASSGPTIGSPLAKNVMTAGHLTFGERGHKRAESLNMTMSMAFDLDPTVGATSPRVGSPTSLRNFMSKDLDLRREAVCAATGTGTEMIKELSDLELDALFDDVQKARAHRRSKIGSMTGPYSGSEYGGSGSGKSEVSMRRAITPADDGEDSDSQSQGSSAFQVREKYMSNGTIDNVSLDTAITLPSVHERKPGNRTSLDNAQPHIAAAARAGTGDCTDDDDAPCVHQDVQELLAEKLRMAEELEAAQRELQRQRVTFEEQMKDMPPEQILPLIYRPLEQQEIATAKGAIRKWRARNYVHMAETVLKKASLLKEAQVMGVIMDKHVNFQFTIVESSQVGVSAYDLARGGLPGEVDPGLEDARKPCVAVRVIDFAKSVIYIWSLEKLTKRIHMMRRMHQYIDRPDYIRHFGLENTFGETLSQQQFSVIGEARIPLSAVYRSTVQDSAVEVISPYTHSVVGIIRLSLEPSTAQAPSNTLKFIVVMRDMVGFAEYEGTHVHAQISIPGLETSTCDGATTTSLVSGFHEGPIRFESMHGMSVPLAEPRPSALRVTVFARVTAVHLEKLTSWDQIRDAPEGRPEQRKAPRIAETEFFVEERNDVFARVQILELAESGNYLPVEVTMADQLDVGTFQLHQGLQRRIALHLTHSTSESLPWGDITRLRVGNIRLLDPCGKVPDMDIHSPDVYLKLIQVPSIKENADGTVNVTLVGQWDSSLHSSQLLDRLTQDKHKIEFTLSWSLSSSKLAEPIVFQMSLRSQILARSHVRPQSMFKQLWNTVRIVRSVSGVFSIVIRPVSAKRAADLWRMNTLNDYVKGEELLTNWAPRKVSLIWDFFQAQKRRRRLFEIEQATGALGPKLVSPLPRSGTTTPRKDREAIVKKYLSLWKTDRDPIEDILAATHTEPPSNGAAFAPTATGGRCCTSTESSTASEPSNAGSSATSASTTATSTTSWESVLATKPRFVAAIQHLPKNPSSLKSGFLFMPDDTYTHWVRRFVDLRLPYLHIHSVPEGDEINAINLAKSHVDHEPDFARLLDETDAGGMGRAGAPGMRFRPNVFAVYSPENTFLFATRTEALKIEWILKIDQGYFSSRTPKRPSQGRMGGLLKGAWGFAS
ncbi:kinesin-like protein Klp8 [Ascosphaera acerosa]|nr:kinesin-like protein Klp8 [Ascosphaera acerosa]